MKICIDPGHGGYDPGAVASDGTMEKTITLAVSQKLKSILLAAGQTVIMTRESDAVPWSYADDLQKRCDIANSVRADFFVSIHANASLSPTASGEDVYVYRDGSAKSFELAKNVDEALADELSIPDRGAPLTAGFYVLKNTTMPAVLVELGFMTSLADLARLKQPWVQDALARAIARGIGRTYGFSTEVDMAIKIIDFVKAGQLAGDYAVANVKGFVTLGKPYMVYDYGDKYGFCPVIKDARGNITFGPPAGYLMKAGLDISRFRGGFTLAGEKYLAYDYGDGRLAVLRVTNI